MEWYDKVTELERLQAEIEHLRTTVNDQAATITGLLREIDRMLSNQPIVRHDTDTRP